jgi:hypothetical protein
MTSNKKKSSIASMKVGKVPFVWRIIDYFMVPLMWVAGGFKSDSMQETHMWHFQKFACALVPDGKGVEIPGTETSWMQERHLILVHIPLIGGWKEYVVLEASGYKKYWNIGWKVKYYDKKKKEKCEIQKLRIYDSRARVLAGQNDSKKIFFALNEKGEAINLKKVGVGRLGDYRFTDVRLF